MTSGGADYYYVRDGLGSVINLANAAGSLQWSYGYEPYGTVRLETQNDPTAPTNLARYTGQLYDQDTGLYHLRARDYDPATGRFLQTDPLSLGTGDPYVSSYAYADQMPTVLVDPSGMAGESAGQDCGSWVEKIPFIGDEWCEGFKTLSPTWQGVVGATVTAGPQVIGPGPGLAVARLGGRFVVREVTGQLHRVISTRVGRAIAQHPTLAGQYAARDPRFVSRAANLGAHSGYQKWHRELDDEIVAWLEREPAATPASFESFLRSRYSAKDLRWRFPTGF